MPSMDVTLAEAGPKLNLRPSKLDDFVGQHRIREQAKIMIGGAVARQEALPHILLNGPQGLGKTTLAYIFAESMGSSVHTTSGPALEKAGDVVGLLNGLSLKDVFFIDEIHRLPIEVVEFLYSAMEDYRIDIVIDQGANARTVRLDLPRFTLIGATTQISKVSRPLQTRFQHIFRMENYTVEELTAIAVRSASLLDYKISLDAAQLLGRASRGTPRIINNLVNWLRDYIHSYGSREADLNMATQALTLKGIDADGVDQTDLRLLRALVEAFRGGPVGLKSLAQAAGEDAETVEQQHEPYLISQGYWQRTQNGRIATPKAWKRLGLSPPGDSTQPSLIL